MNNTRVDKCSYLAAAASLLIAAATCSEAQSPVLYRNDFATRTSSGMIGNGTFSFNYTNGSLINIDGNYAYASQNMQDGWVKGRNNGWSKLLVKETNGNPYACICNTNYGQFVYGLQPIANSLSGGVLRVSCDLRPPRQWSGTSRNMAFYVGPDAFFTQAAEEYYKYCCPIAGIASSDGTDTNFKFRCHDGKGDGTHTGVYGTAPVDTTHWYRYVLELALSSNKYMAAVYDLGTAQPTLATATPGTPVETFGGTNFGFRMNLTPALGGITTLALSAHGALGGDSGEIDIDLTARFDNVRLAFKPAGGSSFAEVYSNDFRTRTYTRLGPGSTSTAYAVGGRDGDTVSYGQGNLLPNVALEFPNGANGPVGQDGWARRNSGGAFVMVTNPANPYVRFHTVNGDNFAYAVQRFGNRLTNGTMRFSIDTRPPNAWYWFTVTKGLLINVGDDAYYNGEKYLSDDGNSFYNHYATRFGFNGSTGSTDIRFVAFDGDGANNVTQMWGTAVVDTAHWYRFVADLDLTNSTVALNIYDMGSAQPTLATSTPGTPVQTFSSFGFRRRIGTGTTNLAGGITSLGLSAFGPRGGVDGTNAPAETALFDNIRVEARPAGYPSSTLIYANDFSSRTYTNLGEYAVASLVGNIDMLAGGQDEWMRRNNGIENAHLSTLGGNAHFRASSVYGTHTYAVQPLGTRVNANILCCQADMRPPRYWNYYYRSIGVYLGDDEFWQGNRSALRFFGTRFAVQFGFGSASAGTDAYGVYPDVSFLTTDGTGAGAFTNKLIGGVVTTNWYRFKAEADLAANTYQVKVYNMGAAQPTLATPTPSSPVAVFTNNRFTTDLQRAGDPDTKLDGLSALGLAAFGVRGGGLYPANETALVDNLLITARPKGTLIRIF